MTAIENIWLCLTKYLINKAPFFFWATDILHQTKLGKHFWFLRTEALKDGRTAGAVSYGSVQQILDFQLDAKRKWIDSRFFFSFPTVSLLHTWTRLVMAVESHCKASAMLDFRPSTVDFCRIWAPVEARLERFSEKKKLLDYKWWQTEFRWDTDHTQFCAFGLFIRITPVLKVDLKSSLCRAQSDHIKCKALVLGTNRAQFSWLAFVCL